MLRLSRAHGVVGTWTLLLVCLLSAFRAEAAFINFENCLDRNQINSEPRRLQWVPLYFDAVFNTTDPARRMNVTIYGNVTGQTTQEPQRPPNDPRWSDPEDTFGKIVNIYQPQNRYTTLLARFDVLTYTPYQADPSPFCEHAVNTTCPIGPAFFANASNFYELPAFSVTNDFYSSYAFSTFATTIRVQAGDEAGSDLACVSANITPALGPRLSAVLTYLPAALLIFVAIATAAAAVYSPWGSIDPFRFTSNYGRDDDLLRLVTPGFGDCLQYIQFVVLLGTLTLSYPAYYQPVLSEASWATLMFNHSFVSEGDGMQAVQDGIYVINGTYGMTRMSQLVGLEAVRDVWAGLMVWLLVIIAAVIVICQIGFFLQWCYRRLANAPEEDLRNKNVPFIAGNVVRIVFNYFLLPLVALSMFQLLVAPRSPIFVVVLAVITLIAIILFAGWMLYVIFSTKPRSHLFDDLPTVILYGPLYNTYSDDAAPFALIPVLITFTRGIAIGAVQPSGIAQLVMLAICEVVLILTLHAFRPFHSPTSMNAYHTFFAVVRLVTILLSVAFVPSLGVTEAPKGWIGYVILLMHAIVLVFGFFLNAVQTLVEVFARLAGAGGDEEGGARRGGLNRVFGLRQLSKRQKRNPNRNSFRSDATMLQDTDAKSIRLAPSAGRSRSLSASSAVLLNQMQTTDSRHSSGLDQQVQNSDYTTTPGTHGAASVFSFIPSAGVSAGVSRRPTIGALRMSEQPSDPYYRPPRQRRLTGDALTPGARSRNSWASGDWASKPYKEQEESPEPVEFYHEGPSPYGPHGTPPPQAFLRNAREDSDTNFNEGRRSKTDYAVRESDFYYGVRGPALSSQATRRLKTGPADPTGPVSSATGWFKGLLGGKTKDKGKGFEVVRSSRMNPDTKLQSAVSSRVTRPEPYHDSPDSKQGPFSPTSREAYQDASEEEGHASNEISAPTSRVNTMNERSVSPVSAMGDVEAQSLNGDPYEFQTSTRISDYPTLLDPTKIPEGIELTSRSNALSPPSAPHGQGREISDNSGFARRTTPSVPRRSSKRGASDDSSSLISRSTTPPPLPMLNTNVPANQRHDTTPQQHQSHQYRPESSASSSNRIPFAKSSTESMYIRASALNSRSPPSPVEQKAQRQSHQAFNPDAPRHAQQQTPRQSYDGAAAITVVGGAHIPPPNPDKYFGKGLPSAATASPPTTTSTTGYVTQQRVSDSIRPGIYKHGAPTGTSAEVISGADGGGGDGGERGGGAHGRHQRSPKAFKRDDTPGLAR